MENIYSVLITAITTLGGAAAFRFYENRAKRKEGRIVGKHPEEWLRQADYDMDTAEFMFSGERYFYTVFMCHSYKVLISEVMEGLEE